jgi:glycosyltransferase involved in cell wall biosynthesis
MIKPLVSVIIPTYNRASTVRRSIDSAINQTYQFIEIILVDDGSTDDTLKTLAAYGEKIRTFYQLNKGPSSARNTGVAHANGEIIAFLDSDDTWMPEKIERQVKMMLAYGNRVSCCVCNAQTISNGVVTLTSFEKSNLKSKPNEGYWLNPAELLATRFILFNQVATIWRDAFEQIGGFKEQLQILEDYDLAFRLSLLGPWAFLSEALVTKYDESDGLGVMAMRSPLIQSIAWEKVMRDFLNEPIGNHKDLEKIILKNVEEASAEIRAIKMINANGIIFPIMGRFTLFFLKIKSAIRRRLPSWPSPVTSIELDSFQDMI